MGPFKKFIGFWFIGSQIIFFSCSERISQEFVTDDPPSIAINGIIDNSGGPYYVEVKQTRSGYQVPFPIENAIVHLVDGEGNREAFEYREDGRYEVAGEIVQGVSGGVYHIEVQVGEEVYFSDPERMPGLLGTNELSWEEIAVPSTTSNGINIEKTLLDFDLLADLPDAEEPAFLQWQLVETYQIRPTDFPDIAGVIPPPCFVTRNIGVQNFYLLSQDEYGNPTYEIESVIQREIDISFLVKHIFSIHQSSITEAYYDYLAQVSLLTENTGSLFDPPLGRISGNIHHQGEGPQALGYFAAVVKDTTHMAVYRGDIDTYIMDICLFDPAKTRYPPFCLDCLQLTGTTLDVPYWWSRVR